MDIYISDIDVYLLVVFGWLLCEGKVLENKFYDHTVYEYFLTG